MLAKVYAAALLGLQTKIIEVEVDYQSGLSHFAIVGLPDKSVQEAKERLTAALRNFDAEFIPRRIVVNLAPADFPKSGSGFDLAIAMGLLVATGRVDFDPAGKAFVGELALDGKVRSIAGVLPIAAGLKEKGFQELFIGADNAPEAALISGLKVYPVRDLQDLEKHFSSTPLQLSSAQGAQPEEVSTVIDLADIRGQLEAKRALEIAAAGGHNLLLSGVPGAGKTLLAKCFPSLLPPLEFSQAVEVSQIHSIAGLLSRERPLLTQPPFRSPHHSTSPVALIGGGVSAKPGEISLAHRGVLFLDELPEFPPPALEALRQPLEDRSVNISRASYNVSYPANFTLLAAMNPCKCGHFGDTDKQCECTPNDVKRYRQRISGPLWDRFDLQVHVHKIDYQSLGHKYQAEDSKTVAARVLAARSRQHSRYSSLGVYLNAELSSAQLHTEAHILPEAFELARIAAEKLKLSIRSYYRILKVARTIADLACVDEVSKAQVVEALSFRVERV